MGCTISLTRSPAQDNASAGASDIPLSTDDSPVGQPLTEFPLFESLPMEIGDRVLDYAHLNVPPQTILIRMTRIEQQAISHTYTTDIGYAQYTIPALLQVSHYTRAHAIKLYPPSFGKCFIDPIYFDPAKDRLLFENNSAMTSFKYLNMDAASLACCRQIRHIAIGGLISMFYLYVTDPMFIDRFEALETLHLEGDHQDAEVLRYIRRATRADVRFVVRRDLFN